MGNHKNREKENKRLANNWRNIIKMRKSKNISTTSMENKHIDDNHYQCSNIDNLNIENIVSNNNSIIEADAKVTIGSGLINIGNSCFFNASLQALIHIPTISICLREKLQDSKAVKCECVACVFLTAYKDIQCSQSPYDPSRLYGILQKTNVHFSKILNGIQQDAHEFLIQFTEEMEKQEHSVLSFENIFRADIIIDIECATCKNVSKLSGEVTEFILDITGNESIQDALNSYFDNQSIVDYACKICKRKVSARKRNLLLSAPRCLWITLQRFKSCFKKVNGNIQITRELKLTNYFSENQIRECNYKLVSVVNHIGTKLRSGHYNTISCAENDVHYQFNDSTVSKIDRRGVKGNHAYILFYESAEMQEDEPLNTFDSIITDVSYDEIDESVNMEVIYELDLYPKLNTEIHWKKFFGNNSWQLDVAAVVIINTGHRKNPKVVEDRIHPEGLFGIHESIFGCHMKDGRTFNSDDLIEVDYGIDENIGTDVTHTIEIENTYHSEPEQVLEDQSDDGQGILNDVDMNESTSERGPLRDEYEGRPDTGIHFQEELDEYDDYNDTNIQCSDNVKFKGRRIFDVDLLFEQLRNVNRHCVGCNSEMIIIKETGMGLRSIFHFQCSECGDIYKIQSSTKHGDTMNINKAVTLGVTSIGSGFYHMEELCAHIEIPCMSSSTFDTENKKIQGDWSQLGKYVATEALQKEIELAVARGDVDSAGNALIAVVCDGSWGKRSYGKGFSSLSGCAAIIGLYTKKVLYFDTKNKYCNICTKSYAKFCPPNNHTCNINYVGPSSGMETEIIVEGFKACELLGARFHKVISDGDSSAFKEISEGCIYQNPDLVVEKIECINHLFKNFRKKMSALSNDTKFERFCRKIMKFSIGDEICKGIRMASKHWRESNLNLNEKLENLEKDCLNAPYHYFGNHDNCDQYFCKKTTTAESNKIIDLLKSAGLFHEILNYCNVYFASNVRSLLEDRTNNSAEEFNNVVAKYLGGKRVNYSLAGSYSARVGAAVVQYNSKGHAGSEFHKFNNINPNRFCLKMENSRIRHYAKNEAARQLKPRKKATNDKTTKGYGDCQKPDMAERALEIAENIELAKLDSHRRNRDLILAETLGQKHSNRWRELRKKLINCSYFGRIIKARGPKSYPNILEEMMYTPLEAGNTAEVCHQRIYEKDSLKMFRLVHKDHELEKTGLFIDQELSYLAAAPCRLYGVDSIVYVQCPAKAFRKTFDEAMSKKVLPFLKQVDGKTIVDVKSSCYMEIQGQLHITGRSVAYLVVWLGIEFTIKKVPVDHSIWNNQMSKKLQFFFNAAMIKELADPRRARKMELRQYNPQTKTFI